MNNLPTKLENKETSYGQNKMLHLNLLSDEDVQAMLTYRKGKGMFKARL